MEGKAIRRALAEAMQRLTQVQFDGSDVTLPVFYPSISSVKTNLAPWDYLQVLVELQFPQFLLSAYDYGRADSEHRTILQKHAVRARENKSVVLLDSGNYEAFWKRDTTWTAADFREAFVALSPNVSFCFDDQDPPNTEGGPTQTAIARTTADRESLLVERVMPIVHAEPMRLAQVVVEVVSSLQPAMVAVAERELGNGLKERCRTILSIRSGLNELGRYCPLHILGTGNPYSILAFVVSGADSFDGLEWCQTVADFSSGQLSHFQHWDLYAETSPLANANNIPYHQKTLAHNLVFWAEFMQGVREFVESGTVSPIIEKALRVVRRVLPA